MFGASIAIVADEEFSHPEHEAAVPVGMAAQLASQQARSGTVNQDEPIGSLFIDMPGLDQKGQPVFKEGFMHKIGGNVKNWKTRFFRLHPGRLNYYKDGESTDRLGSILLPGATLAVFASDVFQSHPFCVGITPQDGNERQYVLDCDSVAHRAAWMAALQVHVKQRIRTSPGTVREGFLTKQGGTFKSWKKRYMILSKTHLKYYPSFTDLHDCLGTIPLGGGFVVGSGDDDAAAAGASPSTPSSSSSSSAAAPASAAATSAPPSSPGGNNTIALANNPYGFSLRSHGNSRTFFFVTNSRSDRDGWVHALQEIQKTVQI